MYPTGTVVTITSVDHLPKPHRHQHLIGRTATVADRDNGMNILTGTGWVIRGYYAFPDEHLAVVSIGAAPRMPRRYRVRAYYLDDD